MNKKIIVIIIAAIAALISCYIVAINNTNKDALKFKQEYESLNGQIDKEGKEYIKMDIDKDNPFVYATYDQVVDLLENGTGIIYFGFPECPWCRDAVPVLIDSAKEVGANKIYYFNALDMRDTKSLDAEGNIVTEKEGTEEYYQLIDILSNYLTPYKGLNDDTIKRLYFPTVVFVKNGEIINAHIGTVESQEDPYVELTDSQKDELNSIYVNQMSVVLDIVCDEAC